MSIKSYLSAIRDKFRHFKRSKYVEGLQNYFLSNETIISNNCLAGFIYQDLGLAYKSPTIGLYFFFPDYIEFLSDLKNNLSAELKFVDKSKYELGNERLKKSKHKYPVGLLNGNIEIHFLHYKNQKEVEDKWMRRVKRVDLNNLVILGTQLDLCTEEDIKNFDALPYKKKIFLTDENYNLKSTQCVYKLKYDHKIGDPGKNGHVLYEHILHKINKPF